jgi:molybdate transport system ATP-binding protein
MLVELSGDGGASCRVETPLGHSDVGAGVTVAMRSGDILLAAEKPLGLSARNILAGRVSRVERRADESLVHVTSGVTWVASVTRQSLQDLGIEVGKTVWLAFKTYSCRLFDAD